jgi:hypothetical protein
MRFVMAMVWAGIVALSTGRAAAQRLPAEGTPVRAKTDFGVVSGKVERRSRDTLWVVDADSKLRAFHRRDIREISTYGVQFARGAKRGAIIGGVLGFITIASAAWYDGHNKEENFLPATIVATPAGLAMPIIGAGIGLFFAPDGWSKPKVYY